VVIAAALAFGAASLGVAGLLMLVPSRAGNAPSPGRPRLLRALVALGAGARGREPPRDLQRRIDAAGRPGNLGPRELMAAKLAGALVSTVAGVPLSSPLPGRLGLLAMVGAPVAGFVAPDVWLERRARERARAVRRQLPALLDLLRVTVNAGASLPAALTEVGERASGPLAAEWRVCGRAVALGIPLADAMTGMAHRLPLPEVRALCGALDRARRHGAPLGATLSAQARDARLSLRRRVQEEAARAGPKIQLVVALLLVPSVLLMVAAALVAALLDSSGLPA
jgi:tight adherence protein C